MGKKLSSQTRKELLNAMRRRYRDLSKGDKTKILSFCCGKGKVGGMRERKGPFLI